MMRRWGWVVLALGAAGCLKEPTGRTPAADAGGSAMRPPQSRQLYSQHTRPDSHTSGDAGGVPQQVWHLSAKQLPRALSLHVEGGAFTQQK